MKQSEKLIGQRRHRWQISANEADCYQVGRSTKRKGDTTAEGSGYCAAEKKKKAPRRTVLGDSCVLPLHMANVWEAARKIVYVDVSGCHVLN